MKEQQQRKAGAATVEARAEWAHPQVKRLLAGAAEGSPVNTVDLEFPS